MKRSKKWITGRVFSTLHNKFVLTYDNIKPMGSFQSGENSLALKYFKPEPAGLTCGEVQKYFNAELRGVFKKQNCVPPSFPQEIEYVIEYGKFISIISQKEADDMAAADLIDKGQYTANTQGVCLFAFYSAQRVVTKTKNDCPSGQNGQTIIYTLPTGYYTSTISQADADYMAEAKAIEDGFANFEEWVQWWVNLTGSCSLLFRSTRKSISVSRDNCGSNMSTTPVTFVIEEGTYTSSISQEDANNQAEAALNAGKQNYANTQGICNIIESLFYNVEKSDTATKNNCGNGYIGTTVTYTISSGVCVSKVSQEEADAQADALLAAFRQVYANEHGTCQFIYYSAVKSAVITKNNCSSGSGTSVTYVVQAGTYTSIISQAAADALAQEDVDNNKQAYANANGSCTTDIIYYNRYMSVSRIKNNCSTMYGSLVSYEVAANTYSSTISQSAADQLAIDDIEANAQDVANELGECFLTQNFYSAEVSGAVSRNNCGAGIPSTEIVYTVPTGKYTSTISQEDADAQAAQDFDDNKQTYANTYGVCGTLYYNAQRTFIGRKSNCSSGEGSLETYTVTAGTYSSTLSQEDAEGKAQDDIVNNAQTYINSVGSCEIRYYSAAKSAQAARNNCQTGVGSTVTYNVPYGRYISTVSQVDADQLAQTDLDNNKQFYANSVGTCDIEATTYYSHSVSVTKIKNTCLNGEQGSSVTYIVPANTYSSTISQAAADALAEADASENSQAYANTNGTCSVIYYSAYVSRTATKNNCISGIGTEITYTVAQGTYVSLISQADADQQAVNDAETMKQSYANIHGSCTTAYFSALISERVTANNCGINYEAQTVTYVLPYGEFTSVISQADANSQARAYFDSHKQAYANTNGGCVYKAAYTNVEKSGIAYKSNCAAGSVASAYTYIVKAGTYSSDISQAAADALAQADVDSNKQAQANLNGQCVLNPCNLKITFTYSRDSATTIKITPVVTNGSGTYTYLWSNGQTTSSLTLASAADTYSVSIRDTTTGCTATGSTTPTQDKVKGLNIEVMYFEHSNINPFDPYTNRLGTGGHTCEYAQYFVNINNLTIGIANLNNNRLTSPDWAKDINNTPPGSYSNPSGFDRYWVKKITGTDAANISTLNTTGKLIITLVWVNKDVGTAGWGGTGGPHSSASWIRIKDEQGTILLSTTISSFVSYTFDPFA